MAGAMARTRLIGYWSGLDLQLLSGTHRHGAALIAGLDRIPVVIKPREDVEAAVGDLELWREVMRTVPTGDEGRSE